MGTQTRTRVYERSLRVMRVRVLKNDSSLDCIPLHLHRLPKKQNCIKFPPTLIIFGTEMAKRIKLYEVHSFSTSPDLRQRTTVLNAIFSQFSFLGHGVCTTVLIVQFDLVYSFLLFSSISVTFNQYCNLSGVHCCEVFRIIYFKYLNTI